MAGSEPCDACGDPIEEPLARTVQLNVDRSEVDSQRLCPACFAEWIERYRTEMQPGSRQESYDEDADIIVD
ncbi:DUF7569 family protein [Halobellus clavatus]|jgi:hypothetical protein|uniref:Small CPxCG-related zinc finger protein n=1 Tax=Halobellus clavatus TaxID=660517 RepID=A0A1H3E5Q6_9EURY|nr:hypothetical protein [Halobellus clavatus]SDX73588.1 hypothetical protein SAMN04487946_10244 [Halobellus clavatus]